MNTLKNILVAMLVVASCFALGFVSGCGIIHGVASDVEVGSYWVRNSLDTTMEKRADNRLIQAEQEKQKKLDRAAAIVLENHEKASSGTNSQ